LAERTDKYLECCLYFTANSLSRTITRMADEEFSRLGLSTSHAFLLMLAADQPGISQKDLAEHLNLAQSTVSRLVDALVLRGFVEKKSSGRLVEVFPTEPGRSQLAGIHDSWRTLYERYSSILGKADSDQLTRSVLDAYRKLSNET